MKLLKIVVLLSVISVLAFGQRGGASRGGGGARSGGGARIGGGGGFRGIGGVARSGGGIARGGSVISRGGGRVGGNGFRGSPVIRGGNRSGINRSYVNRFYGNRYYSSGYYGGYYYPSLYLGLGYGGYPYSNDPYYYDSYAYSAPYYDNGYSGSNIVYAPPAPAAPPAPPTVINQTIGTSAGSFYRAADYYLIAFDDHTIRAALSYTVDGDQIHYVTREHEERTAPLSSVDVRFSEQINRDRRVEFKLP